MREHTDADALRVVLYSHDSVGLGHIRRNLAIAEALAAGVVILIAVAVVFSLLLQAGPPTEWFA